MMKCMIEKLIKFVNPMKGVVENEFQKMVANQRLKLISHKFHFHNNKHCIKIYFENKPTIRRKEI